MKKLLLALLLVTAGCTTIARFDMSTVEKIRTGVTTRGQVVTLLGPPSSVSEYSDGRIFLSYNYINIFLGVEEKKSLNIVIAPNGKAERTYTLNIPR